MPNPKGRQYKTKGKRRMQELVDAALTVFAHFGYYGTIIEKISQTAACTRPLVTQYYGSKENLARVCAAQFIDGFSKNVRKIYKKAATYQEENRLARRQFILHRDKWRFLLGMMCIPAVDELHFDLLPQYLEISHYGVDKWANEFIQPDSIPAFAYLMDALFFCYLIDGNENNYTEAADDLIRQYIKPEYQK